MTQAVFWNFVDRNALEDEWVPTGVQKVHESHLDDTKGNPSENEQRATYLLGFKLGAVNYRYLIGNSDLYFVICIRKRRSTYDRWFLSTWDSQHFIQSTKVLANL